MDFWVLELGQGDQLTWQKKCTQLLSSHQMQLREFASRGWSLKLYVEPDWVTCPVLHLDKGFFQILAGFGIDLEVSGQR